MLSGYVFASPASCPASYVHADSPSSPSAVLIDGVTKARVLLWIERIASQLDFAPRGESPAPKRRPENDRTADQQRLPEASEAENRQERLSWSPFVDRSGGRGDRTERQRHRMGSSAAATMGGRSGGIGPPPLVALHRVQYRFSLPLSMTRWAEAESPGELRLGGTALRSSVDALAAHLPFPVTPGVQ